MRRLIINADDLGLTPGVDRAIFEAHQSGVVTSATLMANSRAFDDAVTLARNSQSKPAPGTPARKPLAIGCHVVLLDGEPLLAHDRVPTLLQQGTSAFRRSFSSFAAALFRGQIRPDEIEAEAAAQIEKVQRAGIRLSHFDTHKHSHLFPSVLKPILRSAKACGVRALRNPFAPIKPLAFAHLLRRPHLWTRYSEVRILRGYAQRFAQLVREEGMVTTDGTFGIVVTGALDSSLFDAIIGSLPEGTWEFCCHPGYNDADLAAVHTRLRESRPQEFHVLTSQAAREAIATRNIELISYADLL